MKYANKIRSLALALTLSVLSLPALADKEVAGWIRDMSKAMEELTYEGTFVYIHDDEVETMEVLHDYDEYGVRERLTSLNGEARVIIRDMDNVTCIWPGSKSVIVSGSQPRSPFPMFDTEKAPDFAQYYDFMMLGDDRVSGYDSQVVAMMPVDEYRYGYKLWIDKETRLLLRSKLLDSEDQVIEQVIFTSLRYLDSTDDSAFDTEGLTGADYQWRAVDNKKSVSKYNDGNVRFSELPDGYAKTHETMRPMRMNENPVRHAVVSDGVATVSVYVEYTDGEKNFSELAGTSSMGAAHAYSRMLEDALITVVGEVPQATVQLIGDAVHIVR